MKKYLFQFVVTLFAITSFTVVACSDDDEPNGSDASSSFTVNSVPYSEHPTNWGFLQMCKLHNQWAYLYSR